MFRSRQPIAGWLLTGAITGICIGILLAASVTVWLVFEVRKEQQMIADLIRDEPAEVAQRIGSLPLELRWQLVFSVLILVVLLVAAISLLLVFRAYWGSQKLLRDIKMQAWHILASMDHAVLTTDRAGAVTSINRRGFELLEVEGDCVGSPISEICVDGLPLDDIRRTVLRNNAAVHDQDFTLRAGPLVRTYRVHCHLLSDDTNNVLGTVIHVRDITDRRLLEERMRRMERYMGLGTLAAGLHHEMKNPLAALSLHVQLLEEHVADKIDAQVAENLRVVKTEMTRISGVLESFRDFASLEKLNQCRTDLWAVAAQATSLIRPQLQENSVEVALEAPQGGLPVNADAMKVEQVLLNVLLNGLEVMPAGGRLTVRGELEDGVASIEIADTGSGIPEDLQGQVFDPYFTTKSSGSGMGLAICEKIMQQHGGRIDFVTGPNGTTFRLTLPTEVT
jgi:two-component system sensor histidine kinase HydH